MPDQYEFRSSELIANVTMVTHRLSEALDNKFITSTIDISKAFDKVGHRVCYKNSLAMESLAGLFTISTLYK